MSAGASSGKGVARRDLLKSLRARMRENEAWQLPAARRQRRGGQSPQRISELMRSAGRGSDRTAPLAPRESEEDAQIAGGSSMVASLIAARRGVKRRAQDDEWQRQAQPSRNRLNEGKQSAARIEAALRGLMPDSGK